MHLFHVMPCLDDMHVLLPDWSEAGLAYGLLILKAPSSLVPSRKRALPPPRRGRIGLPGREREREVTGRPSLPALPLALALPLFPPGLACAPLGEHIPQDIFQLPPLSAAHLGPRAPAPDIRRRGHGPIGGRFLPRTPWHPLRRAREVEGLLAGVLVLEVEAQDQLYDGDGIDQRVATEGLHVERHARRQEVQI